MKRYELRKGREKINEYVKELREEKEVFMRWVF